MRAPLDTTAQLAILADLGIDVWRLRGASDQTVDAPDPTVSAGTRPDGLPAPPAPVAGPIGRQDADFSLVALGQPGALLLLAAEPVGREARFVRDLLAAAARNHRDAPLSRRFDWPPAPGLPGIDQPGASARALAAFLDKARADTDARRVLVDPGVAARVVALELPISVITLPTLADLARDGVAKRALWAALAAMTREPSG